MTLEQLAALAKDATEGQWLNHGPHVFCEDRLIADAKDAKTWDQQCLDGAYIAAASPNVVAALVAEVMAWRSMRETDTTIEADIALFAVEEARTRTDAALKGTTP